MAAPEPVEIATPELVVEPVAPAPVAAEPAATTGALDDDDASEPGRSGRVRRRGKAKPSTGEPARGDPDSLLPSSWRDRTP